MFIMIDPSGGETMADKKALHIVVKGLVQGIGYRYFVQDTGRSMALCGWVRNRSNGDVEIEAFGDPDILERFIRSIRNDHPYARVDDMQIESITTGAKDYSGFKIKL
jgi:acylphosphatase